MPKLAIRLRPAKGRNPACEDRVLIPDSFKWLHAYETSGYTIHDAPEGTGEVDEPRPAPPAVAPAIRSSAATRTPGERRAKKDTTERTPGRRTRRAKADG